MVGESQQSRGRQQKTGNYRIMSGHLCRSQGRQILGWSDLGRSVVAPCASFHAVAASACMPVCSAGACRMQCVLSPIHLGKCQRSRDCHTCGMPVLQSASRSIEVLPMREGFAKLEGLTLIDRFTDQLFNPRREWSCLVQQPGSPSSGLAVGASSHAR